MDMGPESIADRSERAQVRAQARAVWLKSVLVAALVTALALVP